MKISYVGIDVGKLKFFAAVMVEGKSQIKSFDNQPNGFDQFLTWLKESERFAETYHVCMESTGIYSLKLATFLHDQGLMVSIVNPAKIKYFMQSELIKTKTDKSDAKIIARYCALIKPCFWFPDPESLQVLQALSNRLDMLLEMQIKEQNHLESAPLAIKGSIEKMIATFKEEIKSIKKQIQKHIQSDDELSKNYKLLSSVPGLGDRTIVKAMAFFGNINRFSSAKQLSAYVGVNPKIRQSGTSLNSSSLSKMGSSKLRKMLYMPAIVAKQHNPAMKVFYDRLVANGKPKKLAICAVMRKLIHVIYGVLTSNQPFNLEKALTKA